MFSNIKKRFLEFDNNFPKTYSWKLYSSRNEISYVLKGKLEERLTSKIIKSFPSSVIKDEVIVTSYFEPVLSFDLQKTCLIRFRQRTPLNKKLRKFTPPSKWPLGGPGNLEVKIRSRNKKNVSKFGTYLLDKSGQDIYSLIKLAKAERNSRQKLIDFINRRNSEQKTSAGIHQNSHLRLITPEILIKIAKFLTPQFTRINYRRTFETPEFPNLRVTIETHPTYYAYPIEHRVSEASPFRRRYEGFLTESPDRTKVEIKTDTMSRGRKISNKLMSDFYKFRVPHDKLTSEPFPKMVVRVSKQTGTLINERPGREIETKANLLKEINSASTLNKLRNILLTKKNPTYRLFLTEPEIGVRGREERHRTIIGWQDIASKWHEVVTIIRLTKDGVYLYGYQTILKWKSDPSINSDKIMVREEKHEYLREDVDNQRFLRRVSKTTGKKLQIVGVIRKVKYRIIVQDNNGRNFCISLDECKLNNPVRTLKQLEVEYVHTVVTGTKKISEFSVNESCQRCLSYFMKILKTINAPTQKTQLRKIDFVGSSRHQKKAL